MQGYIKLHRQLLNWEWYTDSVVKDVFLHLLLCANHKDNKWRGISIQKGQILTGRLKLASELNFSEMQIRTALKKLKSTNEITIKTTTQYSIITINNWDKYQVDNQQINQQITNEQPTNNQRVTTNNNDNNDNNEKNDNLAPKKLDPYTHPIVEKYIGLHKEILGKRCYLDNMHRLKLVELYSDIEDFEDTLPVVLKRLKHLNFEGIDFTPNSSWLLKNDNYIKVLEGTYGTKEGERAYNAYA